MLAWLSVASLRVGKRQQPPAGYFPWAQAGSPLLAAALVACGGSTDQVAPLWSSEAGEAGQRSEAIGVAHAGQSAATGAAGAPALRAPDGGAAGAPALRAPDGGAAGAPARGISDGGTAGSATPGAAGSGGQLAAVGTAGDGGAGWVAASDLQCDPFGTWLVTYGDEPTTSGETQFCAPGLDEIVVRPKETPGAVEVTFMGRVAGYSNCEDDVAFASVEESSGTISEDGCTLTAAVDVSWCYSGEAQGETRSLSLSIAGDTASGVVYHQPRQCAACSGPTCPEVPFDATAVRAPTDDPVLDACLRAYPALQCEPAPMCMDGFTDIVLYPESAGTFPLEHSAPAELLEVGVARYTNSVCTCDASWSVSRDGVWFDAGPITLCLAISQHDEECGGCLAAWIGGCC